MGSRERAAGCGEPQRNGRGEQAEAQRGRGEGVTRNPEPHRQPIRCFNCQTTLAAMIRLSQMMGLSLCCDGGKPDNLPRLDLRTTREKVPYVVFDQPREEGP